MSMTEQTPGRSCGGCTACCETMEIREPNWKKPAGMRCPYAGATGCMRYETRPDVCRGFECAWLSGFLDEGDRPDKIGAIFTTSRQGKPAIMVHMLEPGEPQGRLKELIGQLLANGRYVVKITLNRFQNKVAYERLTLKK